MFGKGELVLSKDVWQRLINLKFRVTVSRDEQITKQLEEGIYMVAQAAMVDGIIINTLSIDRMLKEQKTNKNRQYELLQEHLTSKVVEETCLSLMKNDWAETSFKTDTTTSSDGSVLYEKELI